MELLPAVAVAVRGSTMHDMEDLIWRKSGIPGHQT